MFLKLYLGISLWCLAQRGVKLKVVKFAFFEMSIYKGVYGK